MFKEIFIKLCSTRGESPSSVCKKIGISAAAFSQWDSNTIPRKVTQQRAADYFGVSVDYLLGKEEKPTATEDGELGQDVIIYHRDGQTKKKKLTKAQMDMLAAMIEALPDDGDNL